jgi:hypothetical protein
MRTDGPWWHEPIHDAIDALKEDRQKDALAILAFLVDPEEEEAKTA